MIRIDKYFSESGILTRSQVKTEIKHKNISLNGKTITSSSVKVDPENDQVTYKGEEITYEPFVYYILNKPDGVVSATEDNLHKTVIDLVRDQYPNEKHDIFPVGRLDIDTRGLLLITNDGAWAHELLSPKKHVKKTYYVEFEMKDGSSMNSVEETENLLKPFLTGVDIGEDEPTKPAEYEALSEKSANLTIVEGRFHQVKRMFNAIGAEVTFLKRIAFGPYKLDDYELDEGRCIKIMK